MSSTVLSAVGWDEGFAIPVANAENAALEDELKRKQKEKANSENKLSEYRDRIQAMTEHLKNVRQELSHSQGLYRARKKEMEYEVHVKALADREMGRLHQEIRKLEKELGAMREKKNSQENCIFKVTQKVEELKCRLSWDQQTLDTWLEESALRDEDTMAIVRYAQQDESRIRELTLHIEKMTIEANQKRRILDNELTETELTLHIEKMTIEANQKRRILDNELTETVTAQIALDKTAENFRQAHMERQELISQWENTIEQMKKRDEEMQQCAMLLAQVNQEVREREAIAKEKSSFLDREVENNKEYEHKIAGADRQAAKLRQEVQHQEGSRVRLQDELESLRCTVDRVSTDVEAGRSQLASMKKDTLNKTNRLKAARVQNAALGEKLARVMESAAGVEEGAAQMEQMLKQEEQTLKEVDSQLQLQREVQFRKSQGLQALRTREKNMVAEISGSRAVLSNLTSRLHKLDQNSLKQQEIIYNQDFQIQLLERKMSRLKGEVSTEEKRVLEKKASELTGALEDRRRTASMLTLQLKRLQDDIRCVRKETEKAGAEKRDLTTKIEELDLFNNTSAQELKKLRIKKQDTMVEDNILKLEVKRLRDLLYNKADSVFSLEKRKLQLQAAMKEREEEIKLHREMLSKQVRISDLERQGLSAEVHERLSKIDKMRKRYEIMTISMAAPEGEGEKSQAYYVIKAAQEKEELQREGDGLDAKIRKTEKEIQALENTLHVIDNHNSTYRKSFHKVPESSEEYQEKLKLEEQKKAAEEKYKHKRRQLRELQEDVQNMKDSLEDLIRDELMQDEKTDQTQTQILSLNKELGLQKEKLDRVSKQCSKLSKEIRSASKSQGETPEERDIDHRQLKDFHKTVNRMLQEAMEHHPDLRSAIQIYFSQADLALPTPVSTPGSRPSSKSASSIRSSGSSSSSTPRGVVPPSPPSRTMDLGMGLSVTSPALAATSPRDSRAGSSAGSSGGSARRWRAPLKDP